MRSLRRLWLSGMAVLVTALAVTSPARAASLLLYDGSTTLIIDDGDVVPPVDSTVAAGAVTFAGDIGVWDITVTTGVTKPVVGSASSPRMNLVVFALSNSALASNTLTVWFSETGFGPSSLGAVAELKPNNTSGTVTYATYQDTGDALFGSAVPPAAPGTLITTTPALGPGAVSDVRSGALSSGAAFYSLTQAITISHGAGNALTTNVDATLAVPDGGMTIALLGLAMIGLEGLRRRLARH